MFGCFNASIYIFFIDCTFLRLYIVKAKIKIGFKNLFARIFYKKVAQRCNVLKLRKISEFKNLSTRIQKREQFFERDQ